MADEWEGERPPPSRLRTAGFAVLAVLVVGLLARPGGEDPGGLLDVAEVEASEPAATPTPEETGPRFTRRPPPSQEAEPEATVGVALPARWEEGAEAQLPDELPASAWDGVRHLYLYGGQSWSQDGERAVYHERPWVYDAIEDRWSELPPPPLEGRSRAAVAWTGTELVVWGGTGRTRVFDDGAAYDPAAGTWRTIAPSPLSPRHGATALSTGALVLVVGGGDNAGGLDDTAYYDPGLDRWLPGPPVPATLPQWGMPMGGITAVGGQPLLWFLEQWGPQPSGPLLLGEGGWEETALPDDPLHAQLWAVATVGDELLALQGGHGMSGRLEGRLVRLPADALSWEEIEPGARLLGHDYPLGAGVGDRYYVLVDTNGRTRAYDRRHDRWLDLPRLAGGGVYYGAAPIVALPDGLLVVRPSGDPTRPARVHRLVIEGEPPDPASAAPDRLTPPTPAAPTPDPDATTPRP